MKSRNMTTMGAVFLVILGATLLLFPNVSDDEEVVTGEIVSREKTVRDTSTRSTEESDVREEPAPIELATTTVEMSDGSSADFRLADGFGISVAAEDVGKARFMTKSPDGRIFVPDLVDYKLSHEGKIFILDDFNEETHEFETKHTYLSGLRGPNSVAFYTDENGQHWIYVALTAHLLRYPYEAGDTSPSADPEVIAEFPNDQVPGQESVVWHITRTVQVRDGRLHVSVGSGCDSCEQPEGEMRGMIYNMNPDGSDKRVVADGLRNAVGFTWADGTIYATENGVDHLGPGAPDGVMYRITEEEHYGWPYCYESDGEIERDTATDWQREYSCDEAPRSFASFRPHTAPLGVEYFPSFVKTSEGRQKTHPVLENSFLVALHGSFEPQLGNGYKIVRVSKEGNVETFADGFLGENNERYARPVDFLQHDENSFFFTDDYRGRIYYVSAE